MANTFWSGFTANKLYLTSGQFTSTLKDSEDVSGVDNGVRGNAWDGTNTPWIGVQAGKLYLQSGQFTSTLKDSEDISGIETNAQGISFDGTDTPWCGYNNKQLMLTSGQFTSTIKTSQNISAFETGPGGISWDGDNTPFIGFEDDKMFLVSGQYTSTIKTSESTNAIDTSAQGISWDGTNTPWIGATDKKLYLTSAQFTSTIKTSEDVSAVDTGPVDIDHGVFAERLSGGGYGTPPSGTNTLVCGETRDKLFTLSGQFTSTIKTSEFIRAIESVPRGISWDGDNTPWCGSNGIKLYLTSGQFTSTLKDSEDINAVEPTPQGISSDGTNTPWCGNTNHKLWLTSGQFTSTIKTSEDINGIDTIPTGISWDGTNTPWIGIQADKLYLTSGQFTSTIKTSVATGAINPSDISWDGTNTPWLIPGGNVLFLTSGQFSSTIKTSQDITTVDNNPLGLDHGVFTDRVPPIPSDPPIYRRIARGGTPLPIAYRRGRVIRQEPFRHFFSIAPANPHSIESSVVRNPYGTWQFSWPVNTAPYSIWLNGELIASGLTTETYEYLGGDFRDTPPPLEILDSGDTAENSTYPPRFLLQWRGITSAAAYVVEQYISSVWTEIGYVLERGKGYYAWLSDALTDAQTHQFRIKAVDQADNEGAALAFSSVIARNPAPPSVAITLSGGILTVSQA